MSKEEIHAYYIWFRQITPERISLLENAVIRTRGYHDWRADYSPVSLSPLGTWFVGEVATRPRAAKEKDELCAGGPAWFGLAAVEDWELTDKTFSLCLDIGMYLGEVLVRNIPEVNWRLISTGSKRYVDYGRPVIGPFKICDFDPVRNVIIMAQRHAAQSYKEGTLESVYYSLLERTERT
jgi:hypothetical protein